MSNLQHFAKTPATRIDSMEVYESPFQSRMSGKLFQSGLRFDDYNRTVKTINEYIDILQERCPTRAALL